MVNKRAIYLLIVFTLLFVTLIGYISYIEFKHGEEYRTSDYNPRNAEKDISVIRGTIFDRNMTELAFSNDTGEKIERVYPYDNLYAHVIGYVAHNFASRTLIEKEYNEELLGGDGINSMMNVKNKVMNEKPRGNDLVLTINHELQQTANSAMGNYRGAIVALSPTTGEIYAMISKPDFNPNPEILANEMETFDDDDAILVSRAFQTRYPPGSTFKTVMAASILENGYGSETYDDSEGIYVIKSADGNPENDYICRNEDAKYAYGETNLEKAFRVSSNVYFAHLATKLTSSQLRETAEKFRFNQKIDFELGAVEGVFQKGDMSDAERIVASIGQGKTEATPLHMALIAATIANKGKMPKPYIVSEVRSGSLTSYKASAKDFGRVISEKDANKIKDMMLDVVKNGTGKNAAISGIDVCGKTGTSENAATVKGESSKTHALFIGFAPYDNPQIAVCVIMEEAGFGGNMAARAAREVMSKYFSLY